MRRILALVLREIPATEADRLHARDKRLARALRAAKGNERRALIAEGQLGRRTP